MRSPFAIFRKHQKVMMVILTGLAMVAFIFLDQIQQSGGQGLLPLFGAMIGGLIGWVIGTQTGKPGNYALAGAILLAMAGLLVPRIGGPTPTVETSVGNLTEQELKRLVQRRQVANNFIRAAYEAGNPLPGAQFESAGAQFLAVMQRFWQQGLQQQLFQIRAYESGEGLERDVVMGHLLRHEAARLGITVSDQAVTEHIKDVSREKLAQKDFKELRSRLGVSEMELYDILRDELQARLALQILAPQNPRTPEQYWQDYCKINVRQALDVAAFSVDDFTKDLSDPPESELQILFDQYKNQLVSDDGTPGFFQSRKLRLAYVEADYASIEKQIPAVTDDEIETHYSANKESYRIDTLPDAGGAKSDAAGSKTEFESTPLNPEFVPEKEPTAAEPKSEADPKSEPKSETEPKPETKPEATPEKPAAEPKSSAPSKDAKEPTADAPGDAGLNRSAAASNVFASISDEAPPTNNSERPSAKDSGKSEPAKAEKTPEPAKETDPAKATKPAKEAEPATPKAASDKEPAAAETPKDAGDPKEKAPEGVKTGEKPAEPKFRPLDDDLKGEIRDQLLRQRTLAAMKERIDQVVAEMVGLGYRFHAPDTDPERLTDQQIAAHMRTFAKEHSLRYAETPLLTARELAESQDHPIGSATEPVDNPFEAQGGATVVAHLFGSEKSELFSADLAVDLLTSNRFAYWPIENVAAHVPAWDEPGVKEQVLQAWRTTQARPKAEERAQAIAKIVSESASPEKTMSDVLAGETVTGGKDDLKLTIQATPEFSWFTPTSNVPRLNPFQQSDRAPLQLSTVPGITNVNNAFMQAVFGLDVGKVGVVANADRSMYYVAKVKKRTSTEPGSDVALKQQFMEENPFVSRSNIFLAQMDQAGDYYRWLDGLERRYIQAWHQPRKSADSDE